MPRETVDVLDPCPKSPYTHFHNWMATAQRRDWSALECFCSRCRMTGIFSQKELEHWQDVIDRVQAAYWQDKRER